MRKQKNLFRPEKKKKKTVCRDTQHGVMLSLVMQRKTCFRSELTFRPSLAEIPSHSADADDYLECGTRSNSASFVFVHYW